MIPIYFSQFFYLFQTTQKNFLVAKGKKVSMYLQRTGRGILGRMWWQVRGEACFPSSVAPLPHGMGGKRLGAWSWTSSPFTLGIPEHLGIPNPAQAHCMRSHHSNHVWSAPTFMQYRNRDSHLSLCHQYQNCSACTHSASQKMLGCLKASLIVCEFPQNSPVSFFSISWATHYSSLFIISFPIWQTWFMLCSVPHASAS